MKPLNILLILIIVPITFVLWLVGAVFLTVGMMIENLSIYLSHKVYGE